MALGIEMQKKRDAAQMSATAVSFFLDHEGHKKFLRATTNQELEVENTALKADNEELKADIDEIKEANDYLYNDRARATRIGLDLERELTTVKKRYDYLKKAHFKVSKELREAHDGKRALEDRVRKAIRKILHPDWLDTEDEEQDFCQEAC